MAGSACPSWRSRGSGEAAAKSLWEEAKSESFISADDISNRAGVSSAVVETLRAAARSATCPRPRRSPSFESCR